MNITDAQPNSSDYELITAEHQRQTWCDINSEYIIDGIKKHGAVLFRGFSAELDDFIAFTDQFCEGYMPNPLPDRRFISKEKNIQTVNLGNKYFPLHAERSQTPFRPDLAFFLCRIAPRSSGQTFFCDGAQLASRFPDSLREQLMSRLLWYRGVMPVKQIMAFLGVTNPEHVEKTLEEQDLNHIYFFRNGKLYLSYMTPFLEKPKFSDDLAFANYLLFSRFFHNDHRFCSFENGGEIPMSICQKISELAEPITRMIDWMKYDLLVLDNTRVMHGRMPIENIEEREILTRFGYANFI